MNKNASSRQQGEARTRTSGFSKKNNRHSDRESKQHVGSRLPGHHQHSKAGASDQDGYDDSQDSDAPRRMGLLSPPY